MANRPLTAIHGGKMYRFIGQGQDKPPPTYMKVCEEILDHFSPPPRQDVTKPTEEEIELETGCQIIVNLIQEMNTNLIHFTSFTNYESELERRIIPLIYSTFEALDEDSANLLQSYFKAYGEMVRYYAQFSTREAIKEKYAQQSSEVQFSLTNEDHLEKFALQWLMRQGNCVDEVLLGMYKPQYVHDIYSKGKDYGILS